MQNHWGEFTVVNLLWWDDNNIIFNDFRKRIGLKYRGWDVPLYFNPVFREMRYWGVVTFVPSQIKVITPYLNFRISSPIAIAIPTPIRSAPTVVTSDEPKSGSIIFPPVYAENPNRISNGGVPYATTFPTNSIFGIVFKEKFAPPIAPRFVYGFFVFPRQVIDIGGESSCNSLTNRTQKSDIKILRAYALNRGEDALSSYSSSSLCISFTVRKKQLLPAPYTSMCLTIHTLMDAIALAVFSNMIIFYDVVCNINLLSLSTWRITLKKNMIIFYIFFGLSSSLFISAIFVCKSLNGGQLITIDYPRIFDSFVFADNETFCGGSHQ